MTIITAEALRRGQPVPELSAGRPVLVLGNFDGVHIGHMELMRAAFSERKRSGGCCVVWTFDKPCGNTGLIMLPDERNRLLANAGADVIVLEKFENVKNLTPEEFEGGIVRGQFNAFACVCGYNYRFGAGAAGDAGTLFRLNDECGVKTVVVPQVSLDGEAVSSSRIRGLISSGDMRTAAKLLGRNYYLKGEVEYGNRIGRTLGFPTANLSVPDCLVEPRYGVYASSVELDGRIFPAVTNIGVRPTVPDGSAVTAETHIIGFSGDLYGSELKVCLTDFMREERKFGSAEELAAQIGLDKERAVRSVR